MTSNHEIVPRQNLWAGNIAKSESNTALLRENVDRRPKTAPPRETLRFSAKKINFFPQDQSFKILNIKNLMLHLGLVVGQQCYLNFNEA